VIDPWNEIEHDKPREMSMTEYVSAAIRLIKRMAKRFDIHIIVVAHPTKLVRDKSGKLPVPSLYDISDSAHWANKPEVGIVIHRDDGGDTMIRVAKSRFHDQIGRPGTVWTILDEQSMRFSARHTYPDDDRT
jgi:twinkle protein